MANKTGKSVSESQKKRHATAQRVRRKDSQPSVGVDKLVKPPRELPSSREHRRMWRDLVAELIDIGVAKNVDRAALVRYVRLTIQQDKAMKKWEEEGISILGSAGTLVSSPAYRGAMNMAKELRALEIQFGMTPASRQRIDAKPNPNKGGRFDAPDAPDDDPIVPPRPRLATG